MYNMRKLLPWLLVLATLVVLFGTVYTVVQQAQRSDANYPQIQLAEDAAAALKHGEVPLGLVYGNVNIATSLAPFTIIYDKTGRVENGSGYLNGHVPKVPLGILSAAKGKEYNAVSWQPQKDVRIAAVTVAAKDYYVLSGRSLREVEKNETRTLQFALLGGIVSMILLAVVFVLNGISTEEY